MLFHVVVKQEVEALHKSYLNIIVQYVVFLSILPVLYTVLSYLTKGFLSPPLEPTYTCLNHGENINLSKTNTK